MLFEFLLAPPREGRRGGGGVPFGYDYISTRAPTGGATFAVENLVEFILISTRAPTGGATGETDG